MRKRIDDNRFEVEFGSIDVESASRNQRPIASWSRTRMFVETFINITKNIEAFGYRKASPNRGRVGQSSWGGLSHAARRFSRGLRASSRAS